MLQLRKENLNKNELDVLISLQNEINTYDIFADKVQIAQTLWNSKGSAVGKKSFDKIKETLKGMCVAVNACNYCEGNVANDIEHIYPKSFFPEQTFIWENYLLACKQCNTGEKLDKCYVMDNTGNVYETARGREPGYKNIAFINPRIENPLKYIWLNLETGEFELNDGLNKFEKNKAKKTIEILSLNEKDYLIEGRKSARKAYYNEMDRLRRIMEAPTIAQIEDLIDPYQQQLDQTQPLMTIKEHIKNATREHLKKMLYPSVWQAIKDTESRINPKWIHIFEIIPESLNW